MQKGVKKKKKENNWIEMLMEKMHQTNSATQCQNLSGSSIDCSKCS